MLHLLIFIRMLPLHFQQINPDCLGRVALAHYLFTTFGTSTYLSEIFVWTWLMATLLLGNKFKISISSADLDLKFFGIQLLFFFLKY